MKRSIFLSGIIAIVGSCSMKNETYVMPQSVATVNDVQHIFSCEVVCLKGRFDSLRTAMHQELQAIFALAPEQRTFANTIQALDDVAADGSTYAQYVLTVQMTNTNKELRDVAQNILNEFEAFTIEEYSQNPEVYRAVKEYSEHAFTTEVLSEEKRYYVTEMLKDLVRAGLHLPAEQQVQLKTLKTELSQLAIEFEANIAKDNRFIAVDKADLAGVGEDFIATLKRDGEKYILGVDYPTNSRIMEHCSVGATRKALWEQFAKRGYPANMDILTKVIALRQQLADILGYPSYAALTIEDSMAASVPTVRSFLNDIQQRIAPKVEQEMQLFQNYLPEGIELVDGKFKPWDIAYTKARYKENHLQVNELLVAEYFPLEHTLKQLLAIYESFLGITFREFDNVVLWDSSVKTVGVYQNDTLLGYLLLDLYPRANKYSHACHITIISPRKQDAGPATPGLSVVIANFPKPTADKPALLQRTDVITFFHEFGHALHAILGATEMRGFAGTSVKRDFVEMPSQMLEEWMWTPEIIKMVSSHYKTGEPLPQDIIDRLRSVKDYDRGDFVQRQLAFALLSLDYFSEGAQKDPHALKLALFAKVRPFALLLPEDYFEASFGHLMGYGASYYGYMWSQVYALDLFQYIKQFGLLNPEIGKRYVHDIIGRGGSAHPQELLHNFLGRNPSTDAFFKDIGIA